MRHKYSYLDPDAFLAQLEERQLLGRSAEGQLQLTGAGERRLRRSAFEEVFTSMKKGGPGYHPITSSGEGIERLPETRPYEFGDDLNLLDPLRSVHNALKRTKGELTLAEQ